MKGCFDDETKQKDTQNPPRKKLGEKLWKKAAKELPKIKQKKITFRQQKSIEGSKSNKKSVV